MYSVPTNSQIIAISAIASAISADMLSARAGSDEITRPGVRCRPGKTARSSTRSPRQTMKLSPSSPRTRLSMGLKYAAKCCSCCRQKEPHHASVLYESQARSLESAAAEPHMRSQRRGPMKRSPSAIRRYDEAWKRLLLQPVPAEVIVQPAANDLRVIIVGRTTGREVRPALRRFAKIGIEVFKAERPLLAGRIFDAAANGKASPWCRTGKTWACLVTRAVGKAAGPIEQPFVSRHASARAQRADPALLVAEIGEVEPACANEISALATDIRLDAKDERATLRIIAKLGTGHEAVSGAAGRRTQHQGFSGRRKLVGTAVSSRPIVGGCLSRRRRRSSFSARCHLDRTHGRGKRHRGNASKEQCLHRLILCRSGAPEPPLVGPDLSQELYILCARGLRPQVWARIC